MSKSNPYAAARLDAVSASRVTGLANPWMVLALLAAIRSTLDDMGVVLGLAG